MKLRTGPLLSTTTCMFVSVVDKKQFTWEKRELIHFRPEIVVKKLEMRGNVTIVQKSKHNHGWPKCPAPQRNPLTRLRLPLPCPGARRAQHLKLSQRLLLRGGYVLWCAVFAPVDTVNDTSTSRYKTRLLGNSYSELIQSPK